ncbi:hypothetical protein ECDEC13D_2619 [Escherichia coli DEC13D]|nr:hypothetical protein ECDEC13C_2779 [Escherichia coli DEC13C]EHX62915.1 hypothetical protein ECDEC13D_2619 [Escherichia coli DEC13D]EHX72773.1 hypothetical protein ECDEC13E_2617 [Escherichia coli DEC13E]
MEKESERKIKRDSYTVKYRFKNPVARFKKSVRLISCLIPFIASERR